MRHQLRSVVVLALMAHSSHAAVVTNAQGSGGNVVVRRSSASEPLAADDGTFLRFKFQSGANENVNTDRIPILKFDLSALPAEPVTAASLRIHLPRGASTNQTSNRFDAGETLYLYGVPNGLAGENVDLAPANTTFANYPYLTGVGSVTNPRPATDLTVNGVNDDLVTLLATYTFAAPSDAGDFVTFQSSALASFLQADDNGIATFLLTMGTIQDFNKTPVVSAAGAVDANHRPSLRTNNDVINTNFDGLGGTDLADFDILKSNFLTGTTQALGDANFDGIVDHADFFLWRTAFLASGGSLEGINLWGVPEPTSCAVAMALAVAGGFALRRIGVRA
ncbi:MAG: hypothetical protein KF847_20165 [Pirellulales bacterium]|nr:hypothetical protein [Pirellulales bacterium]